MKLASLLIALVFSSQVFAQAQTEPVSAQAPEASMGQATSGTASEMKHEKKSHKTKKHHKAAKKHHKKKKHAAAAAQ